VSVLLAGWQDGVVDRPKLIASDVDGTLLDPTGGLTGRTAAAIARVVASGTPFVLVSGRPPRWITPIAERTGLDGYAVCCNGAAIFDIAAEKVLAAFDLEPVLLRDVVNVIEDVLPGIQVATERISADIAPFASEHGYRNPWGDDVTSLLPRAEVLGHPAIKLLIRHAHLTSEEMSAAAREVLDHEVDITFSTNNGLIELSAPGVTKASGLAEVCRLHQVDGADVIAFGDMPNDIEMLRWAGHGVAMANAHRDAIDAADEIAERNTEDGVARVLERWF
jgi:Cof subfamily protein (haloacid dehalogenase superfamily)